MTRIFRTAIIESFCFLVAVFCAGTFFSIPWIPTVVIAAATTFDGSEGGDFFKSAFSWPWILVLLTPPYLAAACMYLSDEYAGYCYRKGQ